MLYFSLKLFSLTTDQERSIMLIILKLLFRFYNIYIYIYI